METYFDHVKTPYAKHKNEIASLLKWSDGHLHIPNQGQGKSLNLEQKANLKRSELFLQAANNSLIIIHYQTLTRGFVFVDDLVANFLLGLNFAIFGKPTKSATLISVKFKSIKVQLWISCI